MFFPHLARPSRLTIDRFVALVSVSSLLALMVSLSPVTTSERAFASHLRGGIVTVEYHAADPDHGHAEEVHVTSQLLLAKSSSGSFGTPSVRKVSGDGLSTTAVSCTSSLDSSNKDTSNPLFDIQTTSYTLTGCFTGGGDFIFTQTSGARISGIANADGTVQYEARLSIDSSNDSAVPTYSSGYMYNIAYSTGMSYSTNMNALGQGNSAVTYELVTERGSGSYLGTTGLGGYGATRIPCSDFNTSTGQLQVAASHCAAGEAITDLNPGSGTKVYAFKVKAIDGIGQYSTRDVLLSFQTTSNNAPVFSATSPSPGSLSVVPGTTETITVSATDVDADVLDFTENLSRAWITESSVTTSGSGASTVYSKTYTLSPPGGTNETVQFEISVFDDDVFSLSASIQYDIEAGGVLPPGTPGTPTLTAGAASLAASFTAPSTGGTVASYRADATPTGGGSTVQVTCSAPPATSCSLSGLSPLVQYSVVIVAINASGSASSSAAVQTTLAASTGGSGSSSGNGSSRDEEEAETPPRPVPAATPRVTTPLETKTPVTQSGPVLTRGVVPVPPKAPTVVLGGRPTLMTTSVPSTTQLDVKAGRLSLGVKVLEDQGTISEAPDGTTQIAVKKGASATITGTGFKPAATVQVFLPLDGDNAKELTRIPVAADGSFDGSAPFATKANEAPLPVGKQVLQLVSMDNDGNQVVVEMTVNIAQGSPAPEANRIEGVIPAMQPGQSIATSGGEPVPVTITPVSDQKLAVVEGDGWTMAVNVTSDQGGVEPAEGGALLKLVRNESALVSGSGFMPGTRADVWLFSDPTLLGTVTIDENGEFTGEVNIDPNMIPVGQHTLQLQGVGEDGYVKAANMGVVVDDAAAVAPTTMEQSLNFIWWIALLVILVALTVVVLVSRRRRQA